MQLESENLDSTLQKVTATCPYVQRLFGEPLLATICPDVEELNQELAALILDEESRQSSVAQSNVGGWQSDKTLLTWKHPGVGRLVSLIDVGVYLLMSELIGEETVDALPTKWNVSAWANVNRETHFNALHYHVGGFWSGVYYVAIPESDRPESGAIVFRNRTLSPLLASTLTAPEPLRKAFKAEICFKPVPGMLLIFPSWVEHWVNPHFSKSPRISIGFDILY
ncbi:MAG: 2OG-Fe(II) oxygenase family protein [Acidobacteria bacterium]|nr:2OG-Fe(II) oxygenase family protein [Acidobacteriota bacterium]